MSPLLETINELRPDLHSLYKELFNRYRQVYQIDYDSLGYIKETEQSNLNKFKMYIESKLSDLLASHNLVKNTSFDDGEFDIKSDLVQMNYTMTFINFASHNLMKIYERESFLRGLITKDEPLKSHAIRDRAFIKSVDTLASNVELVLDSFRAFDEEFAKFNFYLYERYVCDSDEWLQSDISLDKTYTRDPVIDSMLLDVSSTICDAFLTMHKDYSLDYSMLESLDEFDDVMLRVFKSHIEFDLRELAEKYGFRKSRTYIDDTFHLELLDLSSNELSSFMNLISHSGLLSSSLDKLVTRQEIVDEMARLSKLAKPAELLINKFKRFDKALNALNEDLINRYKSFYKKHSKHINRLAGINKHYIGHVEDIYSEFDRLFRILRWHVDCIYDVDYRDIRQLEDLDRNEFNNFYTDTEASIASMLKRHHLNKKIIYQTRSFTLEPADSFIYKEMSLDEFVDSHLIRICNSETLIDLMRTEAAYDSMNDVALRLADEYMSDREIEYELDILRDFIQKMRTVIESFVDTRQQINAINIGLLNEYMQTYHDEQID